MLLGLARIYELKVKAASEEATTILRKIKLMIPESAAAAASAAARAKKNRKSSADKENDAVIDAAPAQLRAKNNAITNHLESGSGLGLDGFGSLGGGLADMDLDAMLDDPEGLVGEELQRALEGMGEPHLTMNLDDGSVAEGIDGLFGAQPRARGTTHALSLTQQHQSSGASVAGTLYGDEDAASKSGQEQDLEMDMEMEGEGLIGAADPNEEDLENLMNNSVADGRREPQAEAEADLASDPAINDVSAATPLSTKRKAAPASLTAAEDNGDFTLDLSGGGGGGGMGDFDEPQAGGGDDDHVSAAAAASAALERTNAEIEEALDQLSALKASKRERAAALLKSKKKRAKTTAYVPVIDQVTEISSSTLKAWLADASDITRPAGSGPRRGGAAGGAGDAPASSSSSGSAAAPLSFYERRLGAARAFMCEGLAVGSSAHSAAWHSANAGDYPASGVGCMGPKLRALMRANFTADVRLKHLPYREPTKEQIAAANASAPPTPLSQGALDDVADVDLDFGAGAADPFAGAALGAAAGDGTEFPDQTQQPQQQPLGDEDGGLGPMELDLGDEELVGVTGQEEQKEEDDFFLHGVGGAQDFAEAILPTDDELTRREKLDDRSDADARLFFGENSKAASSQLLKESVESGWSRRTKRFHELLVTEFKTSSAAVSASASAAKRKAADQEVSLQHVIQGHFKATAAACLYQTLVLASSGFVRPTQAEEYGEVRVAKTATFDSKKLPKLPTQSQPLTETHDSDMSPSL